MKVSVIIPTLNEEHCIAKLMAEMPRDVIDEIIIADGNSTDNTRAIAASLGCKVFTQKSRGYGAAFREAIPMAQGNYVVFMDADGSHNPADIRKIVERMNQGYGYVMASRFLQGGKSEDETWVSYLGTKFLTYATNIIHGMWVTDSLLLFTGITREGLGKLKLKSDGFAFCPEILIRAHQAGLKFAEVSTAERKRYSGSTNVHTFRDGLKILKEIIRLRFIS